MSADTTFNFSDIKCIGHCNLNFSTNEKCNNCNNKLSKINMSPMPNLLDFWNNELPYKSIEIHDNILMKNFYSDSSYPYFTNKKIDELKSQSFPDEIHTCQELMITYYICQKYNWAIAIIPQCSDKPPIAFKYNI